MEKPGEALIETLITLANLPEESMADHMRTELDSLLEQTGADRKEATLEQLREVLALYLESIHSDLSKQAEEHEESRNS